MTRPTSEHIRWGDPNSECPNCTKDADQTDTVDESHWTIAYKYECPTCGAEFWWSKQECDHGLSGWELTVENWGDIRKRDGLNDYYKRDEHFSLSKSPTPCEYNTCNMIDDTVKRELSKDFYCDDCTRNPEVQEEMEEATNREMETG